MKKSLADTLSWIAARDAQFFQIVIGWLMVIVGLVLAYYFGRAAHLRCMRAGEGQANCAITQKLLGSLALNQSQVSRIQQAEVEESYGGEGGSTYRVVFITAAGRVALTGYLSSDYAPKADLVNQVNTFIDSGQQPVLEVQEKIVWWKWLFFISFPALGVGLILEALRKYLR